MEFYTIVEVADKLKVDHKTIRSAIKKGDMDAIMVGSMYRINEDQFQAYITKRTLNRARRKSLSFK